MNVNAEGRSRMMTKVMIGLGSGEVSMRRELDYNTHEYHSQAEYSAVIRSDSVLNPECDVFEASIR
jgi:hypothetical protein